VKSGKGGWTATGRREEEKEGTGGGGGVVGNAGRASGDWVNGAASAAAVVGRFDELTVKKACDLATTVDGSVDSLEHGAAADDDLVISEAGGGSASAERDLAIVEPAGRLVRAELADDLEMVMQCGSSWEREKEAEVSANGSHVWANGEGDLVSEAIKVADDDLTSVFAVNSGYALHESGSLQT